MKKDILIALLAGFAIGGITAVSIIFIPPLLRIKPAEIKPVPTLSVTPSVEKTLINSSIEIDSPLNNQIVTENKVGIKGKARPENIIIIESDLDQTALTADKDGRFEGNITIGEGANTINFTQYDKNGDPDTKKILIFYTPEKI